MDKLSVIIPAYNAEQYLRVAVNSVVNQHIRIEKEIIVVDDGSEDETVKIAENIADVVIKIPHSGAASARNAGLKVATGNLIMFLDADDVLIDGCLEIMLDNIKGHAVVFAKARDFISPELNNEQKKNLSPRIDPYDGVLPGCSIITRDVFGKVGAFDDSLKSGETVAWMMKLRDSGIAIKNTELVSLQRRLHVNNTGRVSKQQEMKNYAAMLRAKLKK